MALEKEDNVSHNSTCMNSKSKKSSDESMRFAFYTKAEPAQSTRESVEAALTRESDKIGKNLRVSISPDHQECSVGYRVRFGLVADSPVDTDEAIDVVQSISGVSRASYGVDGNVIRATITGPDTELS